MLALFGGKPVGKIETSPFPRFTPRAINRVVDLLKRGRTVGLNRRVPEIAEAEDAISAYHGGRRVLGTSSGHSALQMALEGLGIGAGDEVITTPYTWGASVSCIIHQNAIPVFGDVDRLTGLLDPDTIEPLITPRTRAILAVHLYGQPANMTRILDIARRHKLAVIEDGSQAHGAIWKGKVVGNFGDAGGFSCMGGKLLATSEAGYLVTPHEDVFWRAALACQHMGRQFDGNMPDRWKPFVDSLVYTYRLNPITAVLLTEQLKKLDKEIDARRNNVETLRTFLKSSRVIQLPDYGADSRPSYHMMTVNLAADGVPRDLFVKALNAEGLNAFSYVPAPIPQWKRMNGWFKHLEKIRYDRVETPNARFKVDHAIELSFNWTRPDRKAMRTIADIYFKVEAHLEDLRREARRAPAKEVVASK